MNIVIDNTTYTVEQLTAIVRKANTSPMAEGRPYHPQMIDFVDRMIASTVCGREPHTHLALTTLKGALLKTAKAHEILTTSGNVRLAIEALEASMRFVEGEQA